MKAALLPVEEALQRVLASASEPLGEEDIPVGKSLGRTLSRDLHSLRTQPPFANSAMDGYALRAADATAPGARLKLVGESAAGHVFAGKVGPGECARIFTGAPIPEGVDAIALQEDTTRDGDVVILTEAVRPAAHVRTAGIDFAEGETLLPAGRRMTPRDVALAAAANQAFVYCRRRPRVAILATGDELVSPGQILGPAQIVGSNNYFVHGLALAAGGAPVDLGIAQDNPKALETGIRSALNIGADILVTLGGASVGDYDLVQKALTDAGMELGFWKIAMRPGKPLMHGRIGSMRVLGLPGNPTSSAVCGLLFLRPLIRALLGDATAGADPSEPARLAVPLPANGVRADFARATLARDETGAWAATPVSDQDSSLVWTLARADALLVRPADAPAANAGDPCRVIRLEPFGA